MLLFLVTVVLHLLGLLLDQVVDDLVLVDQAFGDTRDRVDLGDLGEGLTHVAFLNLEEFFIFDFLEHAIEAILNTVLRAAWKLLHDL